MLLTLLRASFIRRRSRSALGVLGVAVSAALLLDMVMLSSGMRESFRTLLTTQGFDIRLAPRGTLPFDTEATIDSMTAVIATLRAMPRVATASPVLGGQIYVRHDDTRVAVAAIGIDPLLEGDYELRSGRQISGPGEIVVSPAFLRVLGVRAGDTVHAAGAYDAQMRAVVRERALVVTGVARFIYMPSDPRVVAMTIRSLQEMRGDERRDPASLFMLRLRPGSDADSVRVAIERAIPRVSAISIASGMRQVDERLSYFRQLAFILGSVSLVVGFLLVTTLVTVSVNERLGEIAVMRAIGISVRSVVVQVVLEAALIMCAGSALGLGLGLVTARYLNGILSRFPGLPAAINFFLFQPRDAWIALGLLAACGVLAGIVPAWRGASMPIATTLREEAVA